MPISGKNIFAGTGTSNLITYSAFDVATGTGVQQFYGAMVQSGASEAFILTQDGALYSDRVLSISSNAITSTSYVKANDLDFNVEFLKPQTMEGNAIINVPIGTGVCVGALATYYAHVFFKKVSNGVETDLADSSGAWYQNPEGGDSRNHMSVIRVAVPKTKLRSNDTLRVNIQQYCKVSAGNTKAFVAHDPQNRDGVQDEVEGTPTSIIMASGASILKVNIPFVVNT